MNTKCNKPKVLCIKVPVHIAGFRQILGSFADVEYVEWDYADVVNHIKEYDVIVIQTNTRINAEVIRNAQNLKVIATPSTGTDHIDIMAAKENRISIISLKDDIDFLNKISSTAELAFGLILGVLRHIPESFESVKSGKWDSANFRGHMLMGKTLGIVGAGRLGKMMCRYGNAFGMKVLACDPYKKLDMDDVEQVELGYLLSNSDAVSIHVHLNDETKGMIGKRELGLVKSGAIIINTSRGAVIDEYALVEALERKQIGGAAVDVLSCELSGDIKSSPIVDYAGKNNNVIITPHIGGVTYEAQELAYARTAEKILEWFNRN